MFKVIWKKKNEITLKNAISFAFTGLFKTLMVYKEWQQGVNAIYNAI